ncbi:hypothetical protein [Undibacterium sp. Tian12W]|uniref:hypothetical protein n=1 Tax=Undibacterium sp. Tian12W TaxID=3413054 RepID=UPI003BF21312
MSLKNRIQVISAGFLIMGLFEGIDGFFENYAFNNHGKTGLVEPLKKISEPANNETGVRLTFTTEQGRKVTITTNIDQATSQTLHGGQGMKIMYLEDDPSRTRWPWESRSVKTGLLLALLGFFVLGGARIFTFIR